MLDGYSAYHIMCSQKQGIVRHILEISIHTVYRFSPLFYIHIIDYPHYLIYILYT